MLPSSRQNYRHTYYFHLFSDDCDSHVNLTCLHTPELLQDAHDTAGNTRDYIIILFRLLPYCFGLWKPGFRNGLVPISRE